MAADAQQIYKSVDERGVVTYSQSPPPGAVDSEPVEVAPGPSREAQEAARDRVQAQQQYVDEARDERLEREKAARERAAAEPPGQAKPESPAEAADPNAPGWYPGYPNRPGPPHRYPPVEAPGKGEHPAYRPRPDRPAPRPPRPMPRPLE
jgi:hypothetical protein